MPIQQARVLTAEFLGTFGLVFFGAGAICADALLRQQIPFAPGTSQGPTSTPR